MCGKEGGAGAAPVSLDARAGTKQGSNGVGKTSPLPMTVAPMTTMRPCDLLADRPPPSTVAALTVSIVPCGP